jgi:hypothetical protein
VAETFEFVVASYHSGGWSSGSLWSIEGGEVGGFWFNRSTGRPLKRWFSVCDWFSTFIESNWNETIEK